MKNMAALVLAGLVINFACLTSVSAQQQLTKEEKQAIKIRKQVTKLERHDDPVTVRLRDGDKVKGYISDVADDHFVITSSKGSQPVVVHYANVRDIGVGLGSTAKVALGIAGVFVAIIGLCAVTHRCQE